jgi:hypothetical protein
LRRVRSGVWAETRGEARKARRARWDNCIFALWYEDSRNNWECAVSGTIDGEKQVFTTSEIFTVFLQMKLPGGDTLIKYGY